MCVFYCALTGGMPKGQYFNVGLCNIIVFCIWCEKEIYSLQYDASLLSQSPCLELERHICSIETD